MAMAASIAVEVEAEARRAQYHKQAEELDEASLQMALKESEVLAAETAKTDEALAAHFYDNFYDAMPHSLVSVEEAEEAGQV